MDPKKEEKTKLIRGWDIETSGADLPGGKDIVIAVGCAVVEVNSSTGATAVVARRRWVRSLARRECSVDEWAKVWADEEWDPLCFDEFWAKNVAILNYLMTATPAVDRFKSEKLMAISINSFLEECADKYGDDSFIEVFDTIGFDMTNIEALLVRHSQRTLFLKRNMRKRVSSFLSDVTRAALGFSFINRDYTPEQRAEVDRHNKLAAFEGVSHDHDPANDALCIVGKWIHFALLAEGIIASNAATISDVS